MNVIRIARRATARRAALVLATVVGATGCSEPLEPGAGPGVPPGADVALPFPIDRGDDGAQTPGTYKGLPLRLADNGAPAVTPVDGVIGVVCIGMSNATQECQAFIDLLAGAAGAEVNPQVRVVDCAVGGHAIERWNDPAFDDRLWDDCIGRKLAERGVRPEQVRVIYHKAADQFTTIGNVARPPYPDPESDYFVFLANLGVFASRVREELPSVQAVYTSSRSYGGFAGNPGRGEPLSYEEGHALNAWLTDNPEVGGIWHGWGPYLWAPDCATGVTNGTGVCYVRADYVNDGVHPSASGRAKIASAVHERFLQESWYRR